MIFNLRKFLQSLQAALRGLNKACSEQTFRTFVIFAIFVFILMLLFKVSFSEKLILVLTITMVMSLELINSQIERFLDVFHPTQHPKIKIIKDMTAGAVLLACLGALIIGILIFLPYFFKIIK